MGWGFYHFSVDQGKVVESGTYEELSKEGTGFNAMIKSQLLGIGGVDLPVVKPMQSHHLSNP